MSHYHIALLANILGGLSVVPQLYVVITEWDVGHQISMIWLLLGLMSNLLWLGYGRCTKDTGISILGIIFTMFYAIMLLIKLTENKHQYSH